MHVRHTTQKHMGPNHHYPGMPPPLPAEFYGAHMGQGQFFGDSGLEEQRQHQMHLQTTAGTMKSSTFERPLEQNRSKTNSPTIPSSTTSISTTQSIIGATKAKRERRPNPNPTKQPRDDEDSNAENIDKQIEQNGDKKKGTFMNMISTCSTYV